jgi:hypothetical protein
MRIPIMSEKAPLIPVAVPPERSPHVNRCYKGRSLGRVVTAVAAAGIIYYGVPYGMFDRIKLWMCNSKTNQLAKAWL